MKQNYPSKLQQLYSRLAGMKIPARLIFIAMGIASTVWFLFRVIPKPQRAAYPCMKVAAPVMSSFVIYLLSLSGIVLAFRQSKKKFMQAKYLAAAGFLIVSAISAVVYFTTDAKPASAAPIDGANSPMGTALGVKSGRVVWAWDANATNENCTNTGPTSAVCSGTDSTLMWPSETNSDYYFLKKNNNQTVIDSMVNESLKSLADANDVVEAWDKIFKDFNSRKGKGSVGYVKTEKIFIKLNIGGMWNGANKDPHLNPNPPGYTGCYGVVDGHLRRFFSQQGVLNSNPFAVLSIVKSLVAAGVPDSMIYIGDPIKNVYQDMYDYWKAQFPNLKILGNDVYNTGLYDIATLGRTRVAVTAANKIFYSDKGAFISGSADKLYTIHEQAAYMINMSVLKAHAIAGITLGAKNHFGSQARSGGASQLHAGLLCTTTGDVLNRGGYGLYRVQTDLMGHKLLGGNTVLFIVDGTWAHEEGYDANPMKKWRMAPFNTDYPNSIFMSQDGVAIESVCFDFLRTEYDGSGGRTNRPNYSGTDDYLHQAADTTKWATGIKYDPENDGVNLKSLGVHEHWNSIASKQYSRNLDPVNGKGIQLVGVMKAKNLVVTNDPGTQNIGIDNKTSLVTVYPNPVSEVLHINYSLETKSNVIIEITNTRGEIISVIEKQNKQAGMYTAEWNVNSASGVYLCRLITDNEYGMVKQTLRFQVIK